ncbi:MAG: hypothetical protein AAF171_20215 [Cyanobacteria bacterium P01_A01_bin.116]
MISGFTPFITRVLRFTKRLNKRSFKYFKAWMFLPAAATAVVLWSAIATPAQAYQVQISPVRSVRGDTLSVVIQAESNTAEGPTVTVNGTTSPSFLLSPNRYRALEPTSPNTQAGRMTLSVNSSEGNNNIAVNIGNRNFPT